MPARESFSSFVPMHLAGGGDERKTLVLDTEIVGLLRSRALDCYSPMTGKVSKTLPPHVQPAFVDTQNIGCLISSPNLMSVYPTSLR